MLAVRRFSLWSSMVALCVVGCDREEPLEPALEAAAVGSPGLRAPSETDARPSNSTTIAVAWTDNSNNETGFRIERSATPAGPWTTAGTIGANVTSFSDGGRTSEQQVCYRVIAYKRNGESSSSNTDCSTPPAGPTNLTATVLDHQTIELTWTDNSAVEQGYHLERATAEGGPFSGLASAAADTTRYRDHWLATNTTYWYRVRSTKDGGYGDYSNVATATPVFTPPAAPSGTQTKPSWYAIIVTWVDNATTEDGFRIQRSMDAGTTWVTAFTVGRNGTTTSDYGIQAEQPVCHRVIAYSVVEGDSPPSNAACTTLPAAPTNLTATFLDQQSITLTWTDNSAAEDGYEVQRQGPNEGSYSVVANLPANTTTYRDAGVIIDVRYWYRVFAKKDGGYSSTSNEVSATVATAPPAAPSATDAWPSGSTLITIEWTDQSSNEDGFRIERSIDGGASWEVAGTVAFIQFQDQGRLSEQRVCYRVIAFNLLGDSPPSNTDCVTPPAAPSDLIATPVVGSAIDLTWTDNSGVEDGYLVLRQFTYCDDSGCYSYYDVIATLGPNATRYRDSGLTPGEYYSYFVVALKDGGSSDWSNEATATAQ